MTADGGISETYPTELRRDAGPVVRLDPTRLLLNFRAPTDRGALVARLRQLDLVLEPGDADTEAGHQAEAVNHTDRRIWVRTSLGQTLTAGDLAALEADLGDQLEWIGPVYRHPGVPGRAGLHCPLPDVLVVKEGLADDCLPEGVELRENGDKSRYLPGYRYCTIVEPRRHPAYRARTRLTERAECDDNGILFENMPLLLPYCFEPADTFYAPQPGYAGQWNMVKIHAGGHGQSAWDLTFGSHATTIAVIDSGCDLAHSDLRFVTGAGGPNFDGSTNPDTVNFVFGHGTMVAGVAAATTHNLKGVAGVAGDCPVMPIALGMATDVEVAGAVNYAVAHGARVINMSFVLGGVSTVLTDQALTRAHDGNVILCAAAGNNGGSVGYPARHIHVIACGASDQTDNQVLTATWASNSGPELSVMAPGIGVPTTAVRGNGDLSDLGRRDWASGFWGTSAATPHVTGLAALLLSMDPTLTSDQVRDIIEGTADRVGAVSYSTKRANGPWVAFDGHGRINALDAVLATLPPRLRRGSGT
ncbi:S8 family serine peptidase [Streptomyces sp. NPDC088253]|uniref:S8 family serine peptidase n=1 Tax=Streptomyces sp. NPDC088253 TaxID=3365846 RepID=UPI003828BE5F